MLNFMYTVLYLFFSAVHLSYMYTGRRIFNSGDIVIILILQRHFCLELLMFVHLIECFHVRFEVFMLVRLMMFWAVMPYTLIHSYHFLEKQTVSSGPSALKP